jgi:hypothetical protein
MDSETKIARAVSTSAKVEVGGCNLTKPGPTWCPTLAEAEVAHRGAQDDGIEIATKPPPAPGRPGFIAGEVQALDQSPGGRTGLSKREEREWVAVIGTAGQRGDATRLSREVFDKMCARAAAIVLDEWKLPPANLTLVSGGSAWSDHVAVHLFLRDNRFSSCRLHLFLPCRFQNGKFADEKSWHHCGDVLNDLHRSFSDKAGLNSLSDLQQCAAHRSATLDCTSRGFFARNIRVARKATRLIAFSTQSGPRPIDGGTAHTWKHATAPAHLRRHISTQALTSTATATNPATNPTPSPITPATAPTTVPSSSTAAIALTTATPSASVGLTATGVLATVKRKVSFRGRGRWPAVRGRGRTPRPRKRARPSNGTYALADNHTLNGWGWPETGEFRQLTLAPLGSSTDDKRRD